MALKAMHTRFPDTTGTTDLRVLPLSICFDTEALKRAYIASLGDSDSEQDIREWTGLVNLWKSAGTVYNSRLGRPSIAVVCSQYRAIALTANDADQWHAVCLFYHPQSGYHIFSSEISMTELNSCIPYASAFRNVSSCGLVPMGLPVDRWCTLHPVNSMAL